MKAYTYILLCSDNSYYTGSTNNLDKRLQEHQAGLGANHTRKRLPVKLIYYEEYSRIDEAFIEKSKSKAGVEKRKKR